MIQYVKCALQKDWCTRLFSRESLQTQPEYRRQGLAFKSARAVIKYAYSVLGVDKIHAMTSEDNLASIGLLEKLGLRFETIITLSDDDTGTALYSLADQGRWAKCK